VAKHGWANEAGGHTIVIENGAILEVKGLETSFMTPDGELPAVRDVSFSVRRGECLGIVGESGSGKSVTCLSIMGLINAPGFVKQGEVLFQGKNVLAMSHSEQEDLRGGQIGMVFQDPLSSLNPVWSIERQMSDVITRHLGYSRKDARSRAIESLRQVGVPAPAERLKQYPFQLSGGLRQRVMIAIALSCDPQLIIADEPTTALDVSIQAQILDLLDGLKREIGFSLILVTHDLSIVANLADHVLVMYGGKVMEMGSTEKIFENPLCPYTMALIDSATSIDTDRPEDLRPIEGVPPDPRNLPPGCPFAPRCPQATPECYEKMPDLRVEDEDHAVACEHPLHHTHQANT
jgi:oligopeptide/dipeptide ABC transporter ATP-binding protein